MKNYTPEMMEKAKAAKSVEELLTLAKENGIELTEEEAAKYFAEWHKESELADEELDNVSGGCGDPEPRFHPGNRAVIGNGIFEILEVLEYNEYRGYYYKCRRTWDDSITYVYEDMFD